MGKKNKNKKKQKQKQKQQQQHTAGSKEVVWAAKEMEMMPVQHIEGFHEDDDDGDVTKRSKKVFILADDRSKRKSKSPRKFTRVWREALSEECIGLSICTLVNAFCERYGRVPLPSFYHKGEGSNTLTVEISKNEQSPQTLDDDGEDSNPYLDCNLMETILARLPFPSLMRAKSVCKAWNAVIGALIVNVEADHYFVTHHISHGYHSIAFFSSSLNRWFRIPLQWTSQWTWNCSEPSCSPNLYPCAAGGGLFLFVDTRLEVDIPVVYNPLTKQHRFLHYIPLMDRCSSGMAMELIAEPDHFKVIAFPVHFTRNWHVCPLLYNSSTDKWTSIRFTGKNPTAGISWSDSHPWRSTLHNGTVYCTNSFGHHLGCYDIASGEFEFLVIAGGLPQRVDCHDYAKNFYGTLPSLVVCSGKLILVGRLQRREGEGSLLGRLPLIKHTLVGLWELDISAKIKGWSLISTTPRDLLEDTVISSDGTDFLVGASDQADRIWFMLRGSMIMLSFNVNSMEWSMLPGCPAEDMIDTSPGRAFSAPLRITSCFKSLK